MSGLESDRWGSGRQDNYTGLSMTGFTDSEYLDIYCVPPIYSSRSIPRAQIFSLIITPPVGGFPIYVISGTKHLMPPAKISAQIHPIL